MGNGNERLLSESIANKIKRKIIKGEWSVNEQLPNEQLLAEQLMVSRTTIREAVKILVSKNVLRIKRGKGTFVVGTPGLVDDPLGFEFVDDDMLVRHLLEFRLALEPRACILAADKASEAQIEEMEGLIAAMERKDQALKSARNKGNILDEIANLDASFHALIYKMTQNTVFQRMVPIINNTVIANYTTSLYRRGGQRLAFVDTHKALYNAIRARDSVLAGTLCQEHMEIMGADLCAEIEDKTTV